MTINMIIILTPMKSYMDNQVPNKECSINLNYFTSMNHTCTMSDTQSSSSMKKVHKYILSESAELATETNSRLVS
jgi:hypothetical protein